MVYLDDYIQSFWDEFEKCKNTNDYIHLLEKSELMALEYLEMLKGDEFKSFYDESPLLAMISEVDQVCPEAPRVLAEENVVFSSALFILQDYTDHDRAALRRDFLKKVPENVIRIDFKQKKKG